MRDLSRSLLLATATILCMTIRASPILDISLTSPNTTTNTTAANRRAITCAPIYEPGADIRTCLSLLLALPETTVDGTFHTGGRPDIFLLPIYLRAISCEVSVLLNTGTQELSNWPTIRFAANQIIATCTRSGYPFGRTLGTANVGLNGNIQVFVNHPDLGDLRIT